MKDLFKRIVLIIALVLPSQFVAYAQDVDINKETNIVQVDGKDAFMLVPKNRKLLECDYSLQNLKGEELAYLKYTKYGSDINYYMVFTKSGNQCTLTGFGSINTLKRIAKTVAGANLIQNNVVSETEERKFIRLNYGTFVSAPAAAATQPAMNNAPAPSKGPADIGIKGANIYNNSEMVGVFKMSSEAGITTVSVFNMTDALVCKATHKDNNDNADWNLMIDGKALTVLYNPETPLVKLFKFLAEKGYL